MELFYQSERTLRTENGRELPILLLNPEAEADLVPEIRTDKLGAAFAGLPLEEQLSLTAISEYDFTSTKNGSTVSDEELVQNWAYATPVLTCEKVEAILATETELLLGVLCGGMPVFLGRSADYAVTRYSGDENNGAGYKKGSYYQDSACFTLLYNPSLTNPALFCYDAALRGEREIFIPEGITAIAPATFRGFSNLEKVILPSTLTEIGLHAFFRCTSLREITFPEGLRFIANCAFEECSSLEEISLPDSVTYVGSSAFKRCKKLARVKLPAAITDIANELFFECYALAEIKIPEGVTTVYAEAFRSCVSLTSLALPQGVTRLADGVFRGCYRLKELTLPKDLADYGRRVFDGCEALKIKRV